MSNDFTTTDSSLYTSSSVNETLRLSTDSGQGMDTTTTSQQQSNQTTNSSENRQKKNEHVSRSKKANLIFSVSRVENRLRKGRYAERLGSTAPVYLAGVLEYLVAEVVELAGDITHKSKRKRITPRDIALVIKNDDELNTLCSDVTIPEGGVQPFIHQVLLNTSKRRRSYRIQSRQNNVEKLSSNKTKSKNKQLTFSTNMNTDTDDHLSPYSPDLNDSGVQMQ
ncbi:unnamed protein product [Rotaria socialis]|uniref:Histone H2A n=1 Tax=Rotaria socialis TaxID=392032 RepID=A0A817PTH1_9BILA|nr:unnamed protein product [Rotaria socialis]CAF4468235.1 unnamed protein product [Rotaria socialis]